MSEKASRPNASGLRRAADGHNHASIGVLRKRNGVHTVSNSYRCICEVSSYMVNSRKERVDGQRVVADRILSAVSNCSDQKVIDVFACSLRAQRHSGLPLG